MRLEHLLSREVLDKVNGNKMTILIVVSFFSIILKKEVLPSEGRTTSPVAQLVRALH